MPSASYEGDEATSKPTEPSLPQPSQDGTSAATNFDTPAQSVEMHSSNGGISMNGNGQPDLDNEPHAYGENIYGEDGPIKQEYDQGMNGHYHEDSHKPVVNEHGFSGTVGIKEDG